MNDIDLAKYKNHPRILEVRFIILFDMFEREYGTIAAMKFYETIASAFHCDMTKMTGLINKRFDIKRYSKTKMTRWKQEVIFMGACWGDSIYKVTKDYLLTHSSNVYGRPDLYDYTKFATIEWLKILDSEATLCGMSAYQIEVKRFFEVVDNLASVLIRWKG